MLDVSIMAPVLRVEDLTVRFTRRDTDVAAVNGVNIALNAGETLTILGESGSGKSVSLKAMMGLLPGYAKISGRIWLNGQEMLSLPLAALAELRGGAISMIFQEPMAAPDPVYTIGEQIAETIVQHEGCSKDTAWKRALELLEQVKIPSAARRLKNFPHEMSGGMRQRAMIALALACSPYTKGLLSSTVHGAMRGTRLETIPGSPPNLAHLPPGCAFAPRCKYAVDACRQGEIPAVTDEAGQMARCIRVEELMPA